MSSKIRDQAEPKLDKRTRLVEYISGVDDTGVRFQYFGTVRAPSKEQEIHTRADKAYSKIYNKVQNNIELYDNSDMERINADQLDVAGHWGTLHNNYEWHRYVDNDGRGYNAFKTNIISEDDTTMSYGRNVRATHDYGYNFDEGTIHAWGPSSNTDGSTGVSIGIPPSISFSWSTTTYGVNADYDSDEPKIHWAQNLPTGHDDYIFIPGSTLVAESKNPGEKQKLAELRAHTGWGGLFEVYELDLTWNIYTYGYEPVIE